MPYRASDGLYESQNTKYYSPINADDKLTPDSSRPTFLMSRRATAEDLRATPVTSTSTDSFKTALSFSASPQNYSPAQPFPSPSESTSKALRRAMSADSFIQPVAATDEDSVAGEAADRNSARNSVRPAHPAATEPAIDPRWNLDISGDQSSYFTSIASELNANDVSYIPDPTSVPTATTSTSSKRMGSRNHSDAEDIAISKGIDKSRRGSVLKSRIKQATRTPPKAISTSLPRTPSGSSLSKRPSVPMPPVPNRYSLHPDRQRSLSLMGSSSQPMVLANLPPPLPPSAPLVPQQDNPTLAAPRQSEEFQLITVAIVGTRGCGKSALVRKMIKHYNVTLRDTLPLDDIPLPSAHLSIEIDNNGAMQPVRIIEIDASFFAKGVPPTLPELHGCFICYDSSNSESFAPVPELLETLRGVSNVLLATKCDLECAVNPDVAADMTHPYNVGLIEASITTETGKSKARKAFDWLIKSISRSRRDPRNTSSSRGPYRNPASPEILEAPRAPWDGNSFPNHATTRPTIHSAAASEVSILSTTSAPSPGAHSVTPSSEHEIELGPNIDVGDGARDDENGGLQVDRGDRANIGSEGGDELDRNAALTPTPGALPPTPSSLATVTPMATTPTAMDTNIPTSSTNTAPLLPPVVDIAGGSFTESVVGSAAQRIPTLVGGPGVGVGSGMGIPALRMPPHGSGSGSVAANSGIASPTRAKSTPDLTSAFKRDWEDNPANLPPVPRIITNPNRGASIGGTEEFVKTIEERQSQIPDQEDSGAAGSTVGGDGGSQVTGTSSGTNDAQQRKGADPPPLRWATLDEILDKLLFVAVSGDDPVFIQHFFLTFRRFASPRSVLLGMQKRMRQLSQESRDPLLAKYAQMRICNLLYEWKEQYPSDFGAVGTFGALSALLKQIILNVHLVHYGSDLVPFLEQSQNLRDEETSWCKKEHNRHLLDDDDSEIDEEDELYQSRTEDSQHSSTDADHVKGKGKAPSATNGSTSRARAGTANSQSSGGMLASDLAKAMASASLPPTPTPGRMMTNPRNIAMTLTGLEKHRSLIVEPRKLLRVSTAILQSDGAHVAQEITRKMASMFVLIEHRDWLRHALSNSSYDKENDSIGQLQRCFNYLVCWTGAMISVYDKPASRLKIAEKLIGIARSLRVLNNYCGMRAILVGINCCRGHDQSEFTSLLATRPAWRTFQSLNILLENNRAGHAYRTALKHTTGPAIPDMERHTSDIARTHELNPDFNPENPELIHWGKFTILGRLVSTVIQYQQRCKTMPDYENLEPRPRIYELVFDQVVWDYEALIDRENMLMDEMQQESSSTSGIRRLLPSFNTRS